MSVSVKTSHLAPARFSKISFGLTETHPIRTETLNSHKTAVSFALYRTTDRMHRSSLHLRAYLVRKYFSGYDGSIIDKLKYR